MFSLESLYRGDSNEYTQYIKVEPACGKASHSLYNFCSENVRACMRACVRPSGFVRVITSTFMHGFKII